MKRRFAMLGAVLALALCLTGCGAAETEPPADLSASAAATAPSDETAAAPAASTAETAAPAGSAVDETVSDDKEDTEMKMNVQVGDATFTATLEDNAAVDALVEMMQEAPVTIQMSDYAGFEKVGPLGTSLPTSNHQTTTQAGDIVLYQGNQIVMFYGSNSWSYTRLGRIDDLTGWADALGSTDVTVTFSIGE